jgi:HD superfamily phosphohydrolase
VGAFGWHGDTSAEYVAVAGCRREILVAALLHDIGHGPFSHLFERALPKPEAVPPDYPKKHEDWSERIIRERLSGVLGGDVDAVIRLITGRERQNLLARDFISSQLDADRMDYLLRDSRACGPRYGEFDLEWLLHSVRIGKVAMRGAKEPVWRLCFRSRKARHVVEEYIQAREFMYEQVYMHKTTRAYEAMFEHVLQLAAEITQGDPTRAPQPCPGALAKMLARKQVSTEEYLSLDDFRLWTTLVDWSQNTSSHHTLGQQLQRKARRLTSRMRPYRCIELEDRGRQDRAVDFTAKLASTPLRFSCALDFFRDVAYRNVFYRKSRESEEESDRVIHFVDDDGMTRAAESISPVIDAISRIESSIYRLYYDDEDAAMVARLRQEGWLPQDAGQEGPEP